MANDKTQLGTILQSVDVQVSGYRVNNINPPKTVASMYLQPAYNDWRQYMANYYLYLPFIGVIPLDSAKYVNHEFSIDLLFDVRTGNLKYNLKSDDVVLESHEGCIRVNMPVTASSPYAAAHAKIGGVTETVNSSIGAILSAKSGNVMGVINGVEGTAKGIMDIVKPVQQTANGGFTPSTSIYDSLHIYLITETPEIYYGDGIESRYGYPDNRFISIGSCSGYVEIADVELNTSATESEQEEIKSLLMGGIVV